MDAKEKGRLKRKIAKELKEIQETVDDLSARKAPVAPDTSLGRLTRMGELESQGLNDQALSVAQRRLNDLQGTLRLIDSPTFGICAKCGEPIPLARMEARPESKLCVPCMEPARR